MALLTAILSFASSAAPETGPIDSNEEPQNYRVTDCEEGQSPCQPLVQCVQGRSKCVFRKVYFDVEECAKKEPRQKCLNFSERLSEVTLVTDSYNFISAPLSKPKVKAEIVSDTLKVPWDIEFLPDGSLLATEKEGKLKHITPDGKSTELLSLDVITTHEAGLMGLAIDPDFADNGFVYAAYTYKLDDTDPAFAKPKMWTHQRVLNKVSRWTFRDGKLQDETLILDGLPGSVEHCGLRIEFGADGKLYVSTGDATRWHQSQDMDFLGGKILRANADGTIPHDNPDPKSYVYSRGHRNPQGMAWDQAGEMYASEHGPQRFDEINRIVPGGNYGWGSYKCDTKMAKHAKPEDRRFPVVCFRHWNLSPSGMTFVTDPASPWYGSLFVAGLRGKHLHRYKFDDKRKDELVENEIFYVSDGWDYKKPGIEGQLSRRLRDVEYFGGALYVIGDTFGLVKLTPLDN
ncbi:MAG: hypothetical protein Hals2KO_29000 [Halioglobus sp.]